MTEQLTQADLDRMTAEHKYEEIDAARVAGRCDRLLGVPEADIELLGRARTGVITTADVVELNKIGRRDLVDKARASNRIAGSS